MTDDIQKEFLAMIEAAKQAQQDKRAEMLREINEAWPTLSQEFKDWMYYRMQFVVAMKQARKGSRLQRAWRWLLAWLYQLPYFRARR